MSIPVDVTDLARALEAYPVGYLVSVADDRRAKVVTVEPTLVDGALVVTGPGGGTLRNVAATDTVTLAFPPAEPRGFTLLVDGTAAADGEDVRVTPTSAVLHRPKAHADGPPAPFEAGPPTACENQCAPL